MAGAWKSLIDERIPDQPGVYVIFDGDKVLYVGSSCKMRARLHQHGINWAHYSTCLKTPWGFFRKGNVKFRPSRKYGDWAMVELRLIRRLRPRHNKRHIPMEDGNAA